MMRPVPRGTLAMAGMAAGVVVGLVDGLWAAIAVGTDVPGGVIAALLVIAVDGLLGAAAGLVLEVVFRSAAWGRSAAAEPSLPPRMVATLLFGVAAAAVTVVAAIGTVERRNRLLGAGVAGLVALAAGLLGWAVVPALARLLSRPRGPAAGAAARSGADAALLLTAPLAVIAVESVIMLAVMDLRAPVSGPSALRRLVVTGIEAGLLPAFLLWAERLPARLRLAWALPAVAVAVAIPLVTLAAANWSAHLRFIPWTHVVPALAIVAVTLGNTLLVARPLEGMAWRRRLGITAAAAVVMLAVTLVTAESETARKVTSARAGLVGPVLARARQTLDGDRDGYPRLLGGGDCNDRDAAVHPGVLDFPDDGLDQDCDGKDASVAVLAPPPFAPVPAGVPGDLNLVLITIDTLRADHLGCYGYTRPTSPTIDALSAEGALFMNGWAHAPSTRYSMPAIATGRWPSAIVWDESIWWPRIGPSVPTIAELLKAQGYSTAAFYSYEYFSPADRRGFERGVDLYRADRAALHRAVNGPMESRGSSSREIADDAIAFFETQRARKFFLWLHFYDPHLSYEPHPEVPSFGSRRVDLYDGEIRFTDLHVGRVLEGLRAQGLWDRTAVVLTGDHGEGFGEHGVTEHGFHLYAAQTKVPLIVRVPGLPPRRITGPAGHVDIAPTLINLARGPQFSFSGRSLVGELTPASGQRRVAPPPPPLFQEVTSERGKKRALVTEDLHLIWNWTPDNTTECYDRHADPEERRDIWGRTDGGACRRLKSDLQAMVSALSMPTDFAQKVKTNVFAPGAPAPAPAVALNASIGEMVRVGGYTVTPAGVIPSDDGGEVELAISFECARTMTEGWRFFFHLLGPAGSFRNLDHIPVEGAMPPERWRPGQRIIDRIRVAFPPGTPPGTYEVVVGLYRGSDRLPVTPPRLSNGKNALRLAAIQIR